MLGLCSPVMFVVLSFSKSGVAHLDERPGYCLGELCQQQARAVITVRYLRLCYTGGRNEDEVALVRRQTCLWEHACMEPRLLSLHDVLFNSDM